MTKRPAGLPLAMQIDPAAAMPLYRQVYDGVREAIIGRRLRPQARLPSTRSLAADLSVSRNTVIAAFGMLATEGYLECRVGAGTRVAAHILDDTLAPAPGEGPVRQPRRQRPSRRGQVLASLSPFQWQAGVGSFPIDTWARLTARHLRGDLKELFRYGEAAGLPALRDAVAGYVRAARGVRCTSAQVIIVSGSQLGLHLCAQLLLDPGSAAWIEEPGYPLARVALASAAARIVPIPVDAEGLRVTRRVVAGRRPRVIYVTPSHQYPLGMTMSLPRRIELLAMARANRAWIVEDDYDSEYRFESRPVSSLQGLDNDERVIYVGTLSKVLFPSLRLGYVIVPPHLVALFTSFKRGIDGPPPFLDQAVLADFIREGHLERHIRKMRAVYAKRRSIAIEALQQHLNGLLDLVPSATGMQLAGWLPPDVDDVMVARSAAASGVYTRPLSPMFMRASARGGLLFNYGVLEDEEIPAAVQRLARIVASSRRD